MIGQAIPYIFVARSYVDELLSPTKKGSGAAVRLLAYKWRIAVRRWKDRIPYLKTFTTVSALDEPLPPHRRIFQPWIRSGKNGRPFLRFQPSLLDTPLRCLTLIQR